VLKFDGTDHLLIKNIHSPDGLSQKYDIMLILYELMDWKSVAELIEPWPPGDQKKIIEHLATLEAQHIIIASDKPVQEVAESGLSAWVRANSRTSVLST